MVGILTVNVGGMMGILTVKFGGMVGILIVKVGGMVGILTEKLFSNSTFIDWPIVGLLVLLYFIFNVCCCILLHDFNLYFNGSACCNVSYYSYNYVWPYYTVIHLSESLGPNWGCWDLLD